MTPRTLSSSLLFTAALLPVAACALPPSVIVREIPDLGGIESSANAISDSGFVVGSIRLSNSQTIAFRFRNGNLENLGTLGETTFSQALGVNDAGDVVGEAANVSNFNGSTQRGWLVLASSPSQALEPLSAPGTTVLQGYDITNNGIVLGTANRGSGQGIYAYTWNQSGANPVTQPPNIACTFAFGRGVNILGNVVGYITANACTDHEPFFTTQDTTILLPTLGGRNSDAMDINDNNVIVGQSQTSDGKYRAVVWNFNQQTSQWEVTRLPSPVDRSSYALAINNSGDIVGYYLMANNRAAAAIWRDGIFYDLTTVSQTPGYRPIIATDINNLGQISAQGFTPTAQLRALLLNPFCIGDFNADGGVDGRDIGDFFQVWETGDDLADTNLDGSIDGQDVQRFFERWERGEC